MEQKSQNSDLDQTACWKCARTVGADDEYCLYCRVDNYPTPLRFGNYVVRSKLGAGAFGKVWRCYQPGIERDVALKQLHPNAHPGHLVVALNEMKSGGKLDHENFVKLYDADLDNGWIVLEFAAGGSLKDKIEDDPAWVKQNFLRLAREIASALAVAHSQQLIHRDIKPENILLTGNGTVKIADFGIARQLRDDELAQTYAGTPHYMAPEVFTQDKYGVEVDLHSVGVVFYEMLSGNLPFDGGILSVRINKQQAHYEKLGPEITGSRHLSDIIDHLLAEPGERLASAELLLARLSLIDPSVSHGNTIDDMQISLARIYAARSVNQSPMLCVMRLNAALHGLTGGLVHPAEDYGTKRVEAYFPRVFSWLCALCSSLNVRLSYLLWLKYDGKCPHCREEQCVCATRVRLADSIRNAEVLAYVEPRLTGVSPVPKTFLEYFDEFEYIYASNDLDPSEMSRHFFSEVAEVMDALLRIRSLREMDEVVILHLELADVLAWFFALLRVYRGIRPSYFFPSGFAQLYNKGCYACEASPCVCPETESERRMANWRPL